LKTSTALTSGHSTRSAAPSTAARPRPRRAAGVVLLVRGLLILALLGTWEGLVRDGVANAHLVSSPSLIVAKLLLWFGNGILWPHILRTLHEVLLGFGLGLVAALVVGFLLGRRPFLGAVVLPVLVALNAIPRIVLGPLFIIWFGLGIASKVVLAFLLVFFIIVFAVVDGIREIDPLLVANARLLGASERQLDGFVYLPAALVWIFGSLRLAIGFAFTAAVVGEMLQSNRGFGYLLNVAQNAFDTTGMLAALTVLVAIITLFNAVAGLIERRTSAWKTR